MHFIVFFYIPGTFQVIVCLLQTSLNKPTNNCNKLWSMLKVAGDFQLSSTPIKYMAYFNLQATGVGT
jgi:hypothetical protein